MSNKTHFSPACERNREPIWTELQSIIRPDDRVVLEVGAGTGQHAAYMAPRLSGILWYPTDMTDKMAAIEAWRTETDCDRIQPAIIFQLGQNNWPLPKGKADVVFTANTFHIMPAYLVEKLIQQAGDFMVRGNRFVVYGPFKYNGEFTSESNRDFDQQLKQTAAHQGIRDFEWLDELFKQSGFRFLKDTSMPANNQLLAYVKTS